MYFLDLVLPEAFPAWDRHRTNRTIQIAHLGQCKSLVTPWLYIISGGGADQIDPLELLQYYPGKGEMFIFIPQ